MLLVEDNEINQQVAQELLSQAGIRVTIANDGKEGVDMLAARPEDFDGVLMDIQMPVLDGYAATREIRKHARFEALPVIAMTANAMAGDREKALDAGMNDHVSKPIDVKQLFEVLGRWVSAGTQTQDAAPVELGGPTDEREDALDSLEGFDVEEGLSRLGGNRKLYAKLLRDLAREHADDAEVIRETLGRGDTEGARALAHTLKGMAGNLSAQEVYEASAAVEATLKQDNESTRQEQSTENLIAELEAALTTTVAALQVLDGDTGQREEDAQEAVEDGARALTLDRAVEMGNRLRDAVEMGNISQVHELIGLLPTGSPHRRKLSEMVDNFDFQGMVEVATELEEMRP